jgi:hypothetical protein
MQRLTLTTTTATTITSPTGPHESLPCSGRRANIIHVVLLLLLL